MNFSTLNATDWPTDWQTDTVTSRLCCPQQKVQKNDNFIDVNAPAHIITAPAQLLTAPAQPPATEVSAYKAFFILNNPLPN